jgi:hypothetical protein
MYETFLRDPSPEQISVLRERCKLPHSLDGQIVALLDIGKMRGDEFIDRLEVLFTRIGVPTRRYKKPTNTRTAPTGMLQDIAESCTLVVIALSDCGSCTSCSTHDLNDLDRRGVPGVSVLTTEFKDAFAKQCVAIGFAGSSIYVPHPMQNRTTQELHQLGDQSFEKILVQLTEPGVRVGQHHGAE